MSLRLCTSSIPLIHPFRASALARTHFQRIVPKNGFQMRPRSGVQTSSFSSMSFTPRKASMAFLGSRSLYGVAGVATLGVGIAISGHMSQPTIHCEPPPKSDTYAAPPPPSDPLPPPPQSAVNLYELSFGTVCGICAGVFVKKGAKALAFVCGGVFVLLQYFASMSLVRVDWGRVAGRFENLFYTVDAQGTKRPPNVGSLLRWIVNFLTADFQPRATFVAGFALGLRLG